MSSFSAFKRDRSSTRGCGLSEAMAKIIRSEERQRHRPHNSAVTAPTDGPKFPSPLIAAPVVGNTPHQGEMPPPAALQPKPLAHNSNSSSSTSQCHRESLLVPKRDSGSAWISRQRALHVMFGHTTLNEVSIQDTNGGLAAGDAVVITGPPHCGISEYMHHLAAAHLTRGGTVLMLSAPGSGSFQPRSLIHRLELALRCDTPATEMECRVAGLAQSASFGRFNTLREFGHYLCTAVYPDFLAPSDGTNRVVTPLLLLEGFGSLSMIGSHEKVLGEAVPVGEWVASFARRHHAAVFIWDSSFPNSGPQSSVEGTALTSHSLRCLQSTSSCFFHQPDPLEGRQSLVSMTRQWFSESKQHNALLCVRYVLVFHRPFQCAASASLISMMAVCKESTGHGNDAHAVTTLRGRCVIRLSLLGSDAPLLS